MSTWIGWLIGPRRSGSSALPNPPSSFWYGRSACTTSSAALWPKRCSNRSRSINRALRQTKSRAPSTSTSATHGRLGVSTCRPSRRPTAVALRLEMRGQEHRSDHLLDDRLRLLLGPAVERAEVVPTRPRQHGVERVEQPRARRLVPLLELVREHPLDLGPQHGVASLKSDPNLRREGSVHCSRLPDGCEDLQCPRPAADHLGDALAE